MITESVAFRSNTAAGSAQTIVNELDVKSICLGDIDEDGEVRVDNLLILIGDWDTTASRSDLNGDGIVAIQDLLILIGAWGMCP